MAKLEHEISAYTGALHAALRALPHAERADIVQEARTHLEASAQAGRLAVTLAAFGPPDAYARQFLDGQGMHAVADERDIWTAAGNVLGSMFMALLAVMFVTVAVIDMLVPAFGIWVNPASGAVYFGHAGMTTRAQELAGVWLPVGALLAASATALLSYASARAAWREVRRYLKASAAPLPVSGQR